MSDEDVTTVTKEVTGTDEFGQYNDRNDLSPDLSIPLAPSSQGKPLERSEEDNFEVEKPLSSPMEVDSPLTPPSSDGVGQPEEELREEATTPEDLASSALKTAGAEEGVEEVEDFQCVLIQGVTESGQALISGIQANPSSLVPSEQFDTMEKEIREAMSAAAEEPDVRTQMQDSSSFDQNRSGELEADISYQAVELADTPERTEPEHKAEMPPADDEWLSQVPHDTQKEQNLLEPEESFSETVDVTDITTPKQEPECSVTDVDGGTMKENRELFTDDFNAAVDKKSSEFFASFKTNAENTIETAESKTSVWSSAVDAKFEGDIPLPDYDTSVDESLAAMAAAGDADLDAKAADIFAEIDSLRAKTEHFGEQTEEFSSQLAGMDKETGKPKHTEDMLPLTTTAPDNFQTNAIKPMPEFFQEKIPETSNPDEVIPPSPLKTEEASWDGNITERKDNEFHSIQAALTEDIDSEFQMRKQEFSEAAESTKTEREDAQENIRYWEVTKQPAKTDKFPAETSAAEVEDTTTEGLEIRDITSELEEEMESAEKEADQPTFHIDEDTTGLQPYPEASMETEEQPEPQSSEDRPVLLTETSDITEEKPQEPEGKLRANVADTNLGANGEADAPTVQERIPSLGQPFGKEEETVLGEPFGKEEEKVVASPEKRPEAVDKTESIWNETAELVETKIKEADEAVNTVAEDVKDEVTTAVEKVEDEVTNVAEDVKQETQEISKEALDAAQTKSAEIREDVSTGIESVKKDAEKVISGLTDTPKTEAKVAPEVPPKPLSAREQFFQQMSGIVTKPTGPPEVPPKPKSPPQSPSKEASATPLLAEKSEPPATAGEGPTLPRDSQGPPSVSEEKTGPDSIPLIDEGAAEALPEGSTAPSEQVVPVGRGQRIRQRIRQYCNLL